MIVEKEVKEIKKKGNFLDLDLKDFWWYVLESNLNSTFFLYL